MLVVEEQKIEELWDELNMRLQKGVSDIHSLHRSYNSLIKFMSVCMVKVSQVTDALDIDMSVGDYQKKTREMIIQNMHYNERRMLRHLALPKDKKKLASYRDSLATRYEQCKDMQRLLRDKLEGFKFDFNLAGGNHEI